MERSDGASTHFEFNDAGFRWAWDVELGTMESTGTDGVDQQRQTRQR